MLGIELQVIGAVLLALAHVDRDDFEVGAGLGQVKVACVTARLFISYTGP